MAQRYAFVSHSKSMYSLASSQSQTEPSPECTLTKTVSSVELHQRPWKQYWVEWQKKGVVRRKSSSAYIEQPLRHVSPSLVQSVVSIFKRSPSQSPVDSVTRSKGRRNRAGRTLSCLPFSVFFSSSGKLACPPSSPANLNALCSPRRQPNADNNEPDEGTIQRRPVQDAIPKVPEHQGVLSGQASISIATAQHLNQQHQELIMSRQQMYRSGLPPTNQWFIDPGLLCQQMPPAVPPGGVRGSGRGPQGTPISEVSSDPILPFTALQVCILP
ncbi:hypothetical protein Ciccas_007443 [Cichlidogyrus casuarinus]|uniref:Uncharacterized protein n=1 Tax=Cichlidogyrus casuarinus TaxID=1844966 RepID=A0ABD2Q5G1_9PLAT